MKIFYTTLVLVLCVSSVAQDSVRTIAGRALSPGAQNGPSLEARFNDPAALVADAAGNLYIADSRNHLIRKISTAGEVITIIGPEAGLDTPSGLAISPQGIIIADTGNHVIRRRNPNGSITIIAGALGQAGSQDGLGSTARFDTPLGLAISTHGTIYVADCGNHLIRAISPAGVATTIAGSPGAWGATDGPAPTARFNGPIGLALDSTGNLFISDSNNHTIRKIILNGQVTVATWAGAPLENGFTDGRRHDARFFQPAELTFDIHGALYIADSMNHAIRKISTNGIVTTVAGSTRTPGAEDGENGRARLYNPYGLAFLPTGELAVADAYNQTIRNAAPPIELQITAGPMLTLKWNAVIGKTYQLQTANAALDAWHNVADTVTPSSQIATQSLQQGTAVALLRLVRLP